VGGGGLQDTETGLVWTTALTGDEVQSWRYDDANTHIQGLAVGDQTDWRLPTKAELHEAMAHGLANHDTVFDIVGGQFHWTSTAYGNKSHWAVNDSGDSQTFSNGWALRAVAVRGSRAVPNYTEPNVRVFSTKLVTGEDPNNTLGSEYFTLALDTAPLSNVVVPISVSDTTEGRVSTGGGEPATSIQLTFTPTNWNIPQWVRVAAVDDEFIDGDQTYQISVGPTQSADAAYNNLDDPDEDNVTVKNLDNEKAWVLVSRESGLVTSESGRTDSFTMYLHSKPIGPNGEKFKVIVNLGSSNYAEGTPYPTTVEFEESNWNVPQLVTVTGVDDEITDGDVPYQIETSIGTGSSTVFSNHDPADVTVVNLDNDLISYPSGTLNRSIPDPGTIYADISVEDEITIHDVDVMVNINHTYDRDLRVYLIGPDNTRVELFTDVGGSGDNFTNTILDDEATVSISAGTPPFQGRFRPEGSLSGFDGKAANGLWQLEVTDSRRRDKGTLVSWSLIISTAPPSPLLAAAAGSGAVGGRLSKASLPLIIDEALTRWQRPGTPRLSASDIDVRIADLGGATLGLAAGNTIWLDDNAAGWGWFVDPTPHSDLEFVRPGNQGEQNRMDLLSVVMHELGHVLGHDHDDEGVMAETLAPGTRQTVQRHGHFASVDEVFQQTGRAVGRGWLGLWLSEQQDSKRSWAKRLG
jgi:subtilisin-like proprotein convertase family protein